MTLRADAWRRLNNSSLLAGLMPVNIIIEVKLQKQFPLTWDWHALTLQGGSELLGRVLEVLDARGTLHHLVDICLVEYEDLLILHPGRFECLSLILPNLSECMRISCRTHRQISSFVKQSPCDFGSWGASGTEGRCGCDCHRSHRLHGQNKGRTLCCGWFLVPRSCCYERTEVHYVGWTSLPVSE